MYFSQCTEYDSHDHSTHINVLVQDKLDNELTKWLTLTKINASRRSQSNGVWTL